MAFFRPWGGGKAKQIFLFSKDQCQYELVASANDFTLKTNMYVAHLNKQQLKRCPGGMAQWTPHPPQEREDPCSNPARV
jgi:hypothetical protein